MREPLDPGPETQPSLEARPDSYESLTTYPVSREPTPTGPISTGPTPTESTPTKPTPDSPQSEPLPLPPKPVVVPGQFYYLKRPAFVLVLLGVWVLAALIGLGLYYYWFHSLNKTPAVFSVLMFVIVCAVGAQLLAMVERRPLITALAIAVLSAPFAATAAAAALYGAYIFHWLPR